jgi:hypothetical protein
MWPAVGIFATPPLGGSLLELGDTFIDRKADRLELHIARIETVFPVVAQVTGLVFHQPERGDLPKVDRHVDDQLRVYRSRTVRWVVSRMPEH